MCTVISTHVCLSRPLELPWGLYLRFEVGNLQLSVRFGWLCGLLLTALLILSVAISPHQRAPMSHSVGISLRSRSTSLFRGCPRLQRAPPVEAEHSPELDRLRHLGAPLQALRVRMDVLGQLRGSARAGKDIEDVGLAAAQRQRQSVCLCLLLP